MQNGNQEDAPAYKKLEISGHWWSNGTSFSVDALANKKLGISRHWWSKSASFSFGALRRNEKNFVIVWQRVMTNLSSEGNSSSWFFELNILRLFKMYKLETTQFGKHDFEHFFHHFNLCSFFFASSYLFHWSSSHLSSLIVSRSTSELTIEVKNKYLKLQEFSTTSDLRFSKMQIVLGTTLEMCSNLGRYFSTNDLSRPSILFVSSSVTFRPSKSNNSCTATQHQILRRARFCNSLIKSDNAMVNRFLQYSTVLTLSLDGHLICIFLT